MRGSIAAKVSVFVGVLALVISVGLGLIGYYSGSSAVIDQVEQALIMDVEEAVAYLESQFRVQLTALETIAARPEIKSMDWAQQKPVLQSELERLGLYLAMGVVDSTGSAQYTDGTTASLGDRDYVQQALQGRSVVSDLVVSRVTNSLVLMYAVPIEQNGRVVGVLLGRRDAGALIDMTDRLGFGENGWAVILGKDGTTYAHPNREYVMEQRNVFTDQRELAGIGQAIRTLGVGNTGIIRFSMDGIRRILALAPSPSTGWMIGIGALESDVLKGVYSLRNLTALAAAAFLVAGVFAAIFLARQIAKPLHQVQGVIEAAAAGDLTKGVEVRSKDEIGIVAEAVNKTVDNLRELLSLIAETTNDLADTSARLAAASEEVSASVEEVASTTNEFSGTLQTMNANAQTMNEMVQGVSREASEGTQAINGIVNQMEILNEMTHSLASEVTSLGSVSDQIGNIVSAISAIAEQTNLLALNAAIEAARAGEHGRGFAVVADEVRKLAEESSEATKEIAALIGEIQGRISTIVGNMSEGSGQAETALSDVKTGSEILGRILRAVEEINRQVESFTEGLDQINSGGQDIASATEQQAASMEEVANSAQDLMDTGMKLRELVQHFKLRN